MLASVFTNSRILELSVREMAWRIGLLGNKTVLEARGVCYLFSLALKTRLEVYLLLNFIS